MYIVYMHVTDACINVIRHILDENNPKENAAAFKNNKAFADSI